MALYDKYRDKYDNPYTPPNLPETYTIHAVNDWGYGAFSKHIPVQGQPVGATINGVAATFITDANAVLSAGQVRIWYAHPAKTSFWQCSQADNNKTLAITTYSGQGSTFNAETLNELVQKINYLEANGTGGGFTIASRDPLPGAEFTNTGNLTITFSDSVLQSTINNTNIILKDSLNNVITCTFSVNGAVVTVNPDSDLSTTNTPHTITVTTGVSNTSGTPLTQQYSWSLTAVGVVLPVAPSGLNATAGNGVVNLSWNTVTGATSYNVYRSTNGVDYTKVNTTPVTSALYSDTTVVNGTAYTYKVSSVNANGEGNQSTATSPVTPNVSVPSAPTISVSAGNGQNVISWGAVSGATSYNLYSLNSATDVTANTIMSTGTKTPGVTLPYTHPTANGTKVYYVVTAVNAGGESAASNVVNGTPIASIYSTTFSGTTIDTINIGVLTAGSGTVTQNNGLTMTSAANADVAGFVYKTAIAKTTTRVYRLRAKVTTGADSISPFTLIQSATLPSAMNNNDNLAKRRILIASVANSSTTATLYKKDASGGIASLGNTSESITLNTEYDYILEVNATNGVRMIIKKLDGTAIITTAWQAWSTINDDSNPYYLVIGDFVTDNYYHTFIASAFEVI
ncbi:MAG TPA: Ig-like domain-containing protein [Flavobacterium sp.]|nr:Ig-like domain-containing protein [Flavobacterium sp.]